MISTDGLMWESSGGDVPLPSGSVTLPNGSSGVYPVICFCILVQNLRTDEMEDKCT